MMMLFALSPTAFSQPPDRKYLGGSEKQEKMKERFSEIFGKLNLTSEQKQKLEENRTKYKEEANKLREEMRSKKELLREELAKPELDMDKITQIHNDLKAILLKVEDHRLERILEVRRILTPEQLSKFHKKMEKFEKEDQGFRKYRRQ
jgi:Spy/CpxP family protein refolding chaperone